MTDRSIARRVRHTIVTCALLVLSVGVVTHPAWAQHSARSDADWQHGTTLVGFGGVQSASSNISGAAGLGFGWEVTQRFALLGRATWFNVNDGMSDFAATLAAHMPLATARSLVPFVSAGVGMYRASFDSNSDVLPAFYLNRMPGGIQGPGTHTFQDFVVTTGGGVDVFVSKHIALRPEASLMLVTTTSDVRPLGVFGVQFVYHIDPHPIE
jgi:hypothetical protein